MVFLGLLLLLVSCMLGTAVLLRTAVRVRDFRMTIDGIQCCRSESPSVEKTDLTLPAATGPPGPIAGWRESSLVQHGRVSDRESMLAVQRWLPFWPMISTDVSAAFTALSSNLIMPSALHCSV